MSSIKANPAYDPEWYYQNDTPVYTRLSKLDAARIGSLSDMNLAGRKSSSCGVSERLRDDGLTTFNSQHPEGSTRNPFLSEDEYKQAIGHQDDPFSDTNEIRDEERRSSSLPSPVPVQQEKPFHIFTKKQKWVVVGTIGAAGLFSGLSSNIYFPALNAIAKVCL